MGVILRARGASAPWYSKVVPPVTRGLTGWFTFDTDIRRLPLNRVPGRAPATVVGIPTVTANYARFTAASAYIQTDIQETTECTILAVCRAPVPVASGSTTDFPMYVSTFNGPAITPGYSGNAFGVSLYHTNTGVAVGAGRDNGSGGITSGGTTLATSEVATAWGLRLLRISGSNMVRNVTTGQTQTAGNTNTRVLTGNSFRIGSTNSTAYLASADISAIAFYNVALTDAEIDLVVTAMRARAARLGITV